LDQVLGIGPHRARGSAKWARKSTWWAASASNANFEIYEIIAPQPEHVAGELDRHVFIVAEPELPNRLVVARW
jgi:hypothetical protein